MILRKNLYRLGLPHDLFETFQGEVYRLLGYRNQIAHGELQSGIERQTYDPNFARNFSVSNFEK